MLFEPLPSGTTAAAAQPLPGQSVLYLLVPPLALAREKQLLPQSVAKLEPDALYFLPLWSLDFASGPTVPRLLLWFLARCPGQIQGRSFEVVLELLLENSAD